MIPNVQWSELSGVMPPISIKTFRGESGLDKFSIEENFAIETKNLSANDYPAMETRPGFTLVGGARPNRISGLGSWKDSELQAISSGNWYRYRENSWNSLASGLSTSARWSFCNFKGKYSNFHLLGSNGVDPVKKYNGTSVTNLSGAPLGNYVDTHDGRVYLAIDNTVRFSALNDAEDWTDVDPYVGSGTIRINDERGRDIIGMKAGSEHLLAFFPNATYELFGTGPDDFRMIRVADDIGLISNQCVVSVNGVLYWADVNGIYYYTGGARPRKDFSLPVQKYIDGINKDYLHKCSAGTDGQRFYLSIPYGNATEPNVTLVYDPEYSGSWYVWRNMNQLSFIRSNNEFYFGDVAGRVCRVGGATDNGAPIEWSWVSVPFGGTNANNIKLYKLWVIADVPIGSTFNVLLSDSDRGDDWTLAQSIVPKSNLQKQRIIVPVQHVSNALHFRIKLEGTGYVKIHEIVRTTRQMTRG